jgi:hypothetical protein
MKPHEIGIDGDHPVSHEAKGKMVSDSKRCGSLPTQKVRLPNMATMEASPRRGERNGASNSQQLARLRRHLSDAISCVETVTPNEAIREVAAFLRTDLLRNKVIVREKYDVHLPPASGNRVQVQQAMLDLLLSAADPSGRHEGGSRKLAISTQLDVDGTVRVTVVDRKDACKWVASTEPVSAFYRSMGSSMGVPMSMWRSICHTHRTELR